jgi:hypothetical protein
MKKASSPDSFNSTKKNQVVKFAYAFRLRLFLACIRSPIGYRYYECCQVIKFPQDVCALVVMVTDWPAALRGS